MRLEGSLDAFGLPDVLQLLSATSKTGVLRLSRDTSRHAGVGLRAGQLTSVTSERGGDALARRVIGAGLVDDDALQAALDSCREGSASSVVRALLDSEAVELDQMRSLATTQTTDDLGELLRWTTGEFSFADDEPDPDDLGVTLDVSAVVAEGRRRLEVWAELSTWVPGTDAVLSLAVTPEQDPSCTRAEWALLALVDGHRTAADIAAVLGRGEFDVVAALAALVQRGLLVAAGVDQGGGAVADLLRRQAMLDGTSHAVQAEQPVAVGDAELDEPATEGLAVKEPPVEGLAVKEPVAEEPVAEELVAEKRAVEEPTPDGAERAPSPRASTEQLPDAPVTKSLILRLITGVGAL